MVVSSNCKLKEVLRKISQSRSSMFLPISSICRFTVVSLSETIHSTGAGSFLIRAKIISFMAGTTKLSPTLNGKPLFAIKKAALCEAINPLTFCQVFLAKTLLIELRV